MKITIRQLQHKDLPTIANLHLEYLPSRFPESRHSVKLLSLFYRSLSEVGDIALVAEVNGEVVGFVCIVHSLKSIYLYEARKYLLHTFSSLAALICLKPEVVLHDLFGRLQHLLSGSNRRNSELSQQNSELPELRPIVVREDFQGTKVARSLVSAAECGLKARGVSQYFLRVESQNLRAVGFYRKMGFVVKESEGDAFLVMEKLLT